MYDKIIGNIRITIDRTHENIRDNYFCISNASTGLVYLKKTGDIKLINIDKGVIGISKDDDDPSTTILMFVNGEVKMRTFKRDPETDIEVYEKLKDKKLLIAKKGSKQVLFDYANNAVISSEFDSIEPKGNLFLAKINLFVADRFVTLSGFLDPNGNIIDSELYCSELNAAFTIDEFKLKESILRLYPALEKLIEKREKENRKTKIIDFEYEAYKRRRQKKNNS